MIYLNDLDTAFGNALNIKKSYYIRYFDHRKGTFSILIHELELYNYQFIFDSHSGVYYFKEKDYLKFIIKNADKFRQSDSEFDELKNSYFVSIPDLIKIFKQKDFNAC